MNLRTTATTVIALATLAGPTALAVASPLPDPSPRPSPTTVRTDVRTDARSGLDKTLVELRGAYRMAPWPGKRTLHNEIILLLDLGNAAL